MEAVGMGNL